jgi:hypothetical protein
LVRRILGYHRQREHIRENRGVKRQYSLMHPISTSGSICHTSSEHNIPVKEIEDWVALEIIVDVRVGRIGTEETHRAFLGNREQEAGFYVVDFVLQEEKLWHPETWGLAFVRVHWH